MTLLQIVQTLKREKMRRMTVVVFWRRARLVKFYPNTTGSSFATQNVNSKEVASTCARRDKFFMSHLAV